MAKFDYWIIAALLFVAQIAHAGGISDTGVNAYWGSDSHGKGDVIGGSVYEIAGASISRVGSVLTVVIQTNFAGHAGIDSWAAAKGIGYGDVFLSQSWNPYGNDAHHSGDKASNGTKWNWGFSLDNRWSNQGGSFRLYELKGTNAQTIRNSDYYIDCNGCTFRDGQATGVKTSASAYVKDLGKNGIWTVLDNKELRFTIDVASTDLMSFSAFAMHWGETCQNDAIEGFASVVPTPDSLSLLLIGLLTLATARLSRAHFRS